MGNFSGIIPENYTRKCPCVDKSQLPIFSGQLEKDLEVVQSIYSPSVSQLSGEVLDVCLLLREFNQGLITMSNI